MASNPLYQLFNSSDFNCTVVTGLEITKQASHYITKDIVHFFVRIKVLSKPSDEVVNHLVIPNGMTIANYGMVFPVFVSSSQWVKPDKIIYGYCGSSAFSFRNSELTVGDYITVDYIAKIR